MRVLWLSLLALLTALLAVPGRAQAPLVVAANPFLQDLVRVLGEGDVETRCLLPAGVAVRDYEPSPGDGRLLAGASLFVVNGVELEPWLERFVAESGYTGPVVVAGEGLSLLDAEGRLHEPDEEIGFEHGVPDPYAWHDPRNVRLYAQSVATALTDLRPERTLEIEARLRAYLRALDEAHRYAEDRFAVLPARRRVLVTSLESLRYLAHAYDLQLVPVAGPGPGLQPGTGTALRIAATLRDLGAPAAFFAPGASTAALRFIAEESGVALVTTLAEVPAPGSTYLEMFRRNVDTLADALR